MGGQGSCLSDFSPCSGFSDGAGSYFNFVGMNDDDTFGTGSACGCAVACYPCNDQFPENYAAWRGGLRWLRPSRTAFSLDAAGRFRPAVSDDPTPHRIPHLVYFDRAPCWSSFGAECYGFPRGLCECDSPPSCLCSPGLPCPGHFYDAWWYRGYLWSPHPEGGFIDCRRTVETEAKVIAASAGSLYQASFLRASAPRYADFNTRHCASNKFIACAAYIDADLPCPSVFEHPELQSTYNPGAERGQFHYLGIEFHSLRLRDQGAYSGATGERLAVKNRALSRVHEVIDRLSHETYLRGVTGNSFLDIWSRSWSAQKCGGMTVGEYPNSYLRFSGCVVNVVLEVVEWKVHISLVAHAEREVTPGGPLIFKDYLLPTVRVRVYGRIVVRAQFANRSCSLGGREIFINNPCMESAVVRDAAGNSADEIVVVDGRGIPFDAPDSVEWWGYHGKSGVSPWVNVLPWDDWGPAVLIPQCCRLGRALSGLEIHGWPTSIETVPQSQANTLYDGHIAIDFSNQGTFMAVCGEDDGGGIEPGPSGEFPPYTGPIGPSTPFGPIGGPHAPDVPPIGPIGPLAPIGGPDERAPSIPIGPSEPPIYGPIGGPDARVPSIPIGPAEPPVYGPIGGPDARVPSIPIGPSEPPVYGPIGGPDARVPSIPIGPSEPPVHRPIGGPFSPPGGPEISPGPPVVIVPPRRMRPPVIPPSRPIRPGAIYKPGPPHSPQPPGIPPIESPLEPRPGYNRGPNVRPYI